MAQVIVSENAKEDLERLFDFLARENMQWATQAIAVIRDGLGILVTHPLIGRPAEFSLRELVISKGKSGYLALYDYDEAMEEVVVLAIRHQREVGYT